MKEKGCFVPQKDAWVHGPVCAARGWSMGNGPRQPHLEWHGWDASTVSDSFLFSKTTEMLKVNQYKMLSRGEADVSATGLSPNLERTMSVDFTRILLHYEVGVTLPRTDTGEQNSSRGACKINYFIFSIHQLPRLLRCIFHPSVVQHCRDGSRIFDMLLHHCSPGYSMFQE